MGLMAQQGKDASGQNAQHAGDIFLLRMILNLYEECDGVTEAQSPEVKGIRVPVLLLP